MKGGGKAAAPQYGDASTGFEKIVFAIELNAVPYAEPLVKIQEIDAAAQENVLAVVDDFSLGFAFCRWQRIRGGAAAQERPRFEQLDVEAGSSERCRRGEPGESAAGD